MFVFASALERMPLYNKFQSQLQSSMQIVNGIKGSTYFLKNLKKQKINKTILANNS